ncbi:MAG: hypothetical protein Unbinned3972contig1001_33 [Prokaryotic dsDNA virus sp.]|nr:MAG: hypothetical protein Unbinned3972contig1001_33 [Prokaryotic dsDNA virus sp.]|tara:strand:- start:6976 stop:8586 length:1611 start_codon:yes stop_codon:yes gene_type:complete
MALDKPRINATVSGSTVATAVTVDDLEVDSGTLSIDANNNRVGIGTTSPGVRLEVQDTATSSANTGGAIRLSANDGAPMGDSHRLGVIEFTGAEDSSNTQVVGARIEALTDAAWTNAENGTALYFYTTDGNASQTNVLKIDSNQKATFSGEIVAPSLDISGNVDVDGTLEADAITVNGATLSETIADTVGAMVTSNTETGITVTYQDADNTLDFAVGTLNQDTTGTAAIATTVTVADESSDTSCNVLFTTAATGDLAPKSGTNLTFNSSDGTLTATNFAGTLTTASQTNITGVGTISTGTWQGTAIASAYLDADTAHLSGTQTFTGAKTFSEDVIISGTTPKLTIGDDGAEDTMLVFDGNAADYRIGIDDGTDTLEIGKGSAHGTTPVIKIDSSTNLQVMHNSAVADGEYSGDIAMFTAGEDLTAGEVCYFKSDGKMWKAVATAAATSRCVAMATASISADAMGVFLLKGFARFNSEFPTWTVGGALYTPEAETSNKNVPEQTAPDTDGDFVQIIGWAVSADAIWFDPDSTVVEVA